MRWPVAAFVLLSTRVASTDPVRDRVDALPVLATIEHGRARVVIRGTLSRAEQRRAVELVDQVIADVERRFTQSRDHADPTVTLCLLPDARSYTVVASAFGDIPSEWGFYRPDYRIAIANVGQSIGNLRHELVHPLLGDDFPRIPAWLNEGIAALYGTSRPARRGVEFLVNYRLRDLQRALSRGELPTLAELAASTDADVRGDRAPVFYAMARYVLLFVEREGKLGELYAAMRDAGDDRDAQRAVLEHFVDERAFRAWAGKLRF
jgi:hypothetical protein